MDQNQKPQESKKPTIELMGKKYECDNLFKAHLDAYIEAITKAGYLKHIEAKK